MKNLGTIVKKFYPIQRFLQIQGTLIALLQQNNNILINNYINQNLHQNTRYDHPSKLNKYEHKVFSQGGEDGIIQEIFNRVGTTNCYFVEFGVGNGFENNTAYLLLKGWKGLWIESNPVFVQQIRANSFIQKSNLFLQEAFISAENIENLFKKAGVPKEFDLLSIDIDGNDYWVWDAIKDYTPRVLVIEYNGLIPPPTEFIMSYNPKFVWSSANQWYGASLKSLEVLGYQKGYKLVGCNFAGVNAFFVREDLVQDNFFDPFTAENHYEYIKKYLSRKVFL